MMGISFAPSSVLARERGANQVSGPVAGTVIAGPVGAVTSTVLAALLLALPVTIATARPGRAAEEGSQPTIWTSAVVTVDVMTQTGTSAARRPAAPKRAEASEGHGAAISPRAERDGVTTAPQGAGAQGEPPAQRSVAAAIVTADATTITRAGMFLLIAGGLAVAAIVRRTMFKVDTKRRHSRRRSDADLPTVIAAARRAAPPFPLPYSPGDYAGAQTRSNREPEKLDDAQWANAREDAFPGWPLLKSHIGRAYGRAAGGTPPHIVLIWNNDATPLAFVIHLLKHVFQKSEDDAHEIMLDAQKSGVAVCPLYNRIEDAEAKIAVARAQVHQHGHRLELTLLAVV
jgi:ATP-dependent Clp protease adaptor protein ClpS